MALRINNESKEERDAERALWRKQQIEDREFEKTQTMEYQRREDLISERDLWAGTVQGLMDNGRTLDQAIGLADKLLVEYKVRFS